MKKVIFEGVLDGIVIDRIVRDEEYTMPTAHFHPEYEIYYLADGSRYYFIEDKTYTILKGMLVLVNSNQIHKTGAYRKASHDRFLIELTEQPFSGFLQGVCGLPLSMLFGKYAGVWQLDEAGQERVSRIYNDIVYEFKMQRSHYRSFVMLKITELLLYVTRLKDSGQDEARPDARSTKRARIDAITEYILNNYDRLRSLDEICGRFYISKGYLCRIFKDVTGFTVYEYINMRCVKRAQELLEDDEMSIAEISQALGYTSETHFGRMFKKYTETTPMKYRQKMRLIRQKVRERKTEKDLTKLS
jgi:AraC-like DNA-binding protein